MPPGPSIRIWKTRNILARGKTAVGNALLNPLESVVVANRAVWKKAVHRIREVSGSRKGVHPRTHGRVGSWIRGCFRLNFLSRSGQNSFTTFAAVSTPSWMPSLDAASVAFRLSA